MAARRDKRDFKADEAELGIRTVVSRYGHAELNPVRAYEAKCKAEARMRKELAGTSRARQPMSMLMEDNMETLFANAAAAAPQLEVHHDALHAEPLHVGEPVPPEPVPREELAEPVE